MKILHINTNDQGGAAKSCLRLHQGLLNAGIDSHVLMLSQQNRSIPQAKTYQYPFHRVTRQQRVTIKLKRILKELGLYESIYDRQPGYLKNQPAGLETFSFAETPYDITTQAIYEEADIINLHWASGFIDYSSFFSHTNKKIVWTLHDMNPFTGGCHYSGACQKFQTDCINCPQLQGTTDPNYSRVILNQKLNAIRRPLTIVTPSRWLGDLSKSSRLFGPSHHHVIPYGLDTEAFQPRDQSVARELLGLPADKKILLFVAESITNQRKGYSYLIEALNHLSGGKDIALCAIGTKSQVKSSNASIYELGTIADERLMSLAYSAADAFIIPSLEDNLPNTVLEALLCGIPVIGFPIGGVQEMIKPNRNGLLCDEVNAESLAKSIKLFLEGLVKFDATSIREEAVAQYALHIQAEKYRALYEQTLSTAH